jgi:hypothetical protein
MVTIAGYVFLFLLAILFTVGVAALSFYAGMRYTRSTLLPGILASMTEEELDELADRTRAESEEAA